MHCHLKSLRKLPTPDSPTLWKHSRAMSESAPVADAEVEVKSGVEETLDQDQQDTLGQQRETTDGPEPKASTTPSVERRSKSPNSEGRSRSPEGAKTGSTEPREQTLASLWCPVRGRNHANLVEFGLESCPLCKQNLKPPLDIGPSDPQAKSVETKEEASSDGSQSDSDSETAQDSKPRYSIQFLDTARDHITIRPWHELLDLETERAKVSRQTGPPVDTITVVATSLSSEWRMRLAPGQLERVASGLLTNPNYTMEIDYVRVDIGSDHIRQALRQIVTYYPGPRLSHGLNYIDMPYCLFYHHLDAIKSYQRTFKGAKDYDEDSGFLDLRTQKLGFKSCDEITYHHLNVLRNAIESQNLESVLEEKKRHQQSPALATFVMLWVLLKPGTTVYTKIHGRLAACVIKDFNFFPQFSIRKESTAYLVRLWHLQYDGRVLGRHELTRYISTFEGEKRLIDLEIVPASIYDAYDGGCLRKSLEARGEKYFKFIAGPRQVNYRGESLGNVAYWVRAAHEPFNSITY